MQRLIILGIMALAVYVAIRLVSTGLAGLTGSRYRAYRWLASLMEGRYEGRGLGEPPTVSLSHRGAFVRVGLAPTIPGQPALPRTRVVARFAKGIPLRLELAPKARPSPSQPPKGTRPVRVGEAHFDREYAVQANDPEMARDLLDEGIRGAIDALRRLAPPAGMLLSINPERLLVQVDRDLGAQAEALVMVVRRSLAIHDHLVQGIGARLAEGIAIVGVGPAEPDDAGPPICKVCGEPVEGSHVVCTTCRTPHHRDCWSFVGTCSIYGCSGKRCEEAVARPGPSDIAE